MRIWAATRQGVVVLEKTRSGWIPGENLLHGIEITTIACSRGVMIAGSRKGLYRVPSGVNLLTIQEPLSSWGSHYIRWLSAHPNDPGVFLAGTEPAGILMSRDEGVTWQEAPEISIMAKQFGWNLPYSQSAGCIRGFTFQGTVGYAAAEVGGLLVSDLHDPWKLVAGSTGKPDQEVPMFSNFVHPDVHSVESHPVMMGMICAATGGGFFCSIDYGRSWKNFYFCYCRAAWLDPKDPGHMLLGPADSVERNGRIEETFDGGRLWRMASTGLEVPWKRNMVERFCQVGEDLFAVLSGGELLVASLPKLIWQEISGINQVNSVCAEY